jgi:hypothetical protein
MIYFFKYFPQFLQEDSRIVMYNILVVCFNILSPVLIVYATYFTIKELCIQPTRVHLGLLYVSHNKQ